ncbi:hypothetical protein [Belnapia moabensis]|uniref:hypothetical protein n=1 Tax=Belnapia moabensis TaxID=365533 RepID=UPI0012EDCCC2|nr:hypothetical protein [Belnapia moabensis]
MARVRPLAASPPGRLTTIIASAKARRRAIGQRRLDLDAEIRSHDPYLSGLTKRCAPGMAALHSPEPRLRRRC